ncbi:SpaA isopeptide-forming pilin-related protein [Paraconexibacter antarcticus]|uniref:SpaA isopeptide-forming pilin-related protein n=1 Tax=Paraconexibacter antarcticus TaxID=2949664 RepID=A0ABY5DQT7_9ACTN|nr:SpaA isopeptide-forming pilin-related protein [Paraconexibacter antarcticus]UTI64398.1 SpaA isopeptide-forming pilin-related protein [Paraconexibacter antarcticus]
MRRTLSVLPALLVSGLVFAAPGHAAGFGSFESGDGNLAQDSTFDWNSFGAQTYTGTAPYRTAGSVASGWTLKAFEDAQASGTDTGFAGGVKQDDDCATLKGGKAPNKDDLKRIYLATKTVNGDVILSLAWVRIPQNSTSASAHVGYEFNQGASGGCGGSSTLVKRTGGDMLVVYDFEGGSNPPAIKLSRWLNATFTGSPGAVCEVSGNPPPIGGGCWGDTKILTTLGFAQAKVNFGVISSVDALKPGGTDPSAVEFGEAGINLTDAGVFGNGVCAAFGSAYGVSRSSGNSAQAAMEDLVGPGAFTIANCGSVTITKTGSDGGTQAGAVFTLYNGTGTGGTVVGTCTVAADGSCVVAGGTLTTFTNLPPGTYTVHETTVPAGYNAAADQTFSLAAGESKTLQFVDQAAPATVNVTKVDDGGNPVDGAVFTISQGGVAKGSCTTGAPTAGSGQCSITGVTAGTYSIDETTVPAGYAKDASFPQSITLANGETKEVGATDPRTYHVVAFVCRNTDAKLIPSAVTIDGSVRPVSIGTADATASMTEAALCALTKGASATSLQSGSHSATVVIP